MMKSRTLQKKLTSTFTPSKATDETPKGERESTTPTSVQLDRGRKNSQTSDGGASNDTLSLKKEEPWPECPSPLIPNPEDPNDPTPRDLKATLTSGGSFTHLVNQQQRPFQFPSRTLC